MPKSGAPRNRTYAYKQDGKVLSGNANKTNMVEEGEAKARIRVGDQNMKYLKDAQDSEPVYPDTDTLEKNQAKAARKLEIQRQVKKSKARHLEEGKARIKDDMDEAIDMVRKKKSASSNDYNR